MILTVNTASSQTRWDLWNRRSASCMCSAATGGRFGFAGCHLKRLQLFWQWDRQQRMWRVRTLNSAPANVWRVQHQHVNIYIYVYIHVHAYGSWFISRFFFLRWSSKLQPKYCNSVIQYVLVIYYPASLLPVPQEKEQHMRMCKFLLMTWPLMHSHDMQQHNAPDRIVLLTPHCLLSCLCYRAEFSTTAAWPNRTDRFRNSGRLPTVATTATATPDAAVTQLVRPVNFFILSHHLQCNPRHWALIIEFGERGQSQTTPLVASIADCVQALLHSYVEHYVQG